VLASHVYEHIIEQFEVQADVLQLFLLVRSFGTADKTSQLPEHPVPHSSPHDDVHD
jgi:hypothetical protein